ncbi:uncharacterized protein LOC131664520 [Phymastichus coffea]|uniref:uncharacterized protein LOC131664520 n=1 Tax=Phymastichus coffea TaxID=108790 RepID=UPI00273CD172|nr:uncharacterized protein LOC131664520 [Phymastichus coffea]
MENFKQDFDLPNSESNSETEFSRQVEECQSNLYRMEKLLFHLQNDSKRPLRKSQDSLVKLLNCNKKKFSNSKMNEQTPLQELRTKDSLCSNNTALKRDATVTSKENLIKNRNNSPLTFVVQVPNSIVDDLKKNLTNSDIVNYLSQCSSKQSVKVSKKKGISSLFHNLFKRKKNNTPNLHTLLFQNMKFVKFLAGLNEIDAEVHQRASKNNVDQTSVSENYFPIENTTNVSLSSANVNPQDGYTLVFPISLNSNTNISDPLKPKLIIQHEITSKQHSSLYTHTIKISNEHLSNYNNESSSKVVTETVENEFSSKRIAENVDIVNKDSEKFSLNEVQSENSLMKNLIENLLRSTKNFNDLEILKIFVEILHKEKLKKKTPCCIDCSNTKVNHNKESNFLHNFLQQLMVDLQNKIKRNEKKNIQQTPKRQSSKISICSSTTDISSEEEYFDDPVISKSKCMHKNIKRCQSPSLLKYRFCQSEKDIIDKTENKNK